jgi:hypothetical protein
MFAAGTTPGSTFFINVNNVDCVFFTCTTFQFKKYQGAVISQWEMAFLLLKFMNLHLKLRE